MTEEAIKAACQQAIAFLARAESLAKRMNDEGENFPYRSKESGALRRASMDLTRALSELRK